MTQDRTYYRALPVVLLIEQARNSGHEMAIALGERLEEYDRNGITIDDLLHDNECLEKYAEKLEAELATLRTQLEIN